MMLELRSSPYHPPKSFFMIGADKMSYKRYNHTMAHHMTCYISTTNIYSHPTQLQKSTKIRYFSRYYSSFPFFYSPKILLFISHLLPLNSFLLPLPSHHLHSYQLKPRKISFQKQKPRKISFKNKNPEKYYFKNKNPEK